MKYLLRFLSWLKLHIWPIALLVLVTTAASANFQTGVWLTGWDTLHPEVNFALNFSRLFFGVWRADQGLGALAAHAHMSDLPRITVLWIWSIVGIPLESLKFLYILLCYCLGPLGVFFLVRNAIHTTKQQTSNLIQNSSAFLAAVWYAFNLGTVQHFYVVFEMFAVQYAALGWILWLALTFLQAPRRKWLLLFALTSLLATPMAYASMLWFAALGGLGLILITYNLLQPDKRTLLNSAKLLLVFVAMNSFWLLPNLYLLTSGATSSINQSQINRLFSPEAFLHNQAFGTFPDLLLLRNFLFHWQVFNDNQTFSPLLATWSQQYQQSWVVISMYGLAAIAGLGILTSVVKRKLAAIFFLPLIFSAIMLINQNPPFTEIFVWLRSHSTLFEEVLRFPFTKFSLLYMVSFAVFLAMGWVTIGQFVTTRVKPFSVYIQVCLTLLLTTLIIAAHWPIFNGHLITPMMKKPIPQEYLHFFSYAKQLPPTSRTLLLPLETNDGWQYLNWGYEGPGFLWFGLPGSFLTRDFDRWNPYNETNYRQLNQALTASDWTEFKRLLNLYQINYLLLDEHVMLPANEEGTQLVQSRAKAALQALDAQVVWQENSLSLYQISVPSGITVESENELQPITLYSNLANRSDEPAVFPFSDLLTPRPVVSISDGEIKISRTITLNRESVLQPSVDFSAALPYLVNLVSESQQLSLKPAFEISLDGQIIEWNMLTTTIPATQSGLLTLNDQPLLTETTSTVWLNLNRPLLLENHNSNLYASIPTDELRFELERPIPITAGEHQITITMPAAIESLNLGDINYVSCGTSPKTGQPLTTSTGRTTFILEERQALCGGASFFNQHNTDMLVVFNSETTTGRAIKATITKQYPTLLLEELLSGKGEDVFGVIETDDDRDLYISWESRAFGRPSHSELSEVRIVETPLSFFGSYRIENKDELQLPSTAKITSLRTINTYWTEIGLLNPDGTVLSNNQASYSGWIALGNQSGNWVVLNESAVSTWNNTWVIPAGIEQVIVVFWPQLLQWVGAVAGILVAAILVKRTS